MSVSPGMANLTVRCRLARGVGVTSMPKNQHLGTGLRMRWMTRREMSAGLYCADAALPGAGVAGPRARDLAERERGIWHSVGER